MHKKRFLPIGCLLITQAIVFFFNSWANGPGFDEWGHLPSGLYSLQFGDFRPYCVNPPLSRLIAAAPVVCMGGAIPYEPLPEVAGFRVEFFLAHTYVQAHGSDVFFWMSIGRTALIPIAMLGTYLIWFIGGRMLGWDRGLIAAVFWGFSPTVLAFGESVTPDVSCAVFGLLATWRFYVWLRLGTLKSSICCGICLAFGLLSKSTLIILPPLFILLGIVYSLRFRKRWSWFNRAKQIIAIAVSSWFLVHMCYDFRGSFKSLGEFDFISTTLSGIEQSEDRYTPITGNRFRGTFLAGLPMPLPADYIYGIDIQKRDFERKMASYFFGRWRDRGWLSYYVVGIFLKEPLSLWILVVFSCIIRLHSKNSPRLSSTRRLCRIFILSPGILVLFMVSLSTGFNHHLRYALPFLPCLYLLVASLVSAKSYFSKTAQRVLVLLYISSSLFAVPRSYAFFSESIGGSSNGWRYLAHSNLDWGQDLLTVKRWAELNSDRRPLYIVYSGLPLLDFKRLGIDATDGREWLSDAGPLKSGYWVVFTDTLLEDHCKWFRAQDPMLIFSSASSVYVVNRMPVDEQ